MMNSKALKKLRKVVRKMGAAMPLRGLVEGPRRSVLIPGPTVNTDGTPQMVPFTYTGTLRNAAETQRGVYRHCKKLHAQNQAIYA